MIKKEIHTIFVQIMILLYRLQRTTTSKNVSRPAFQTLLDADHLGILGRQSQFLFAQQHRFMHISDHSFSGLSTLTRVKFEIAGWPRWAAHEETLH